MIDTIKTLFYGILLIAIGYATKVFFIDPLVEEAKASEDWPTVQGQITKSQIGKKRDDGSTYYFPEVSFKYAVDGKNYNGSKVRTIQTNTTSSRGVKKTIGRYPVNSPVTVHYDPELPDVSVLEPGVHGIENFVLKHFPTVFMFAGALILISVARSFF